MFSGPLIILVPPSRITFIPLGDIKPHYNFINRLLSWIVPYSWRNKPGVLITSPVICGDFSLFRAVSITIILLRNTAALLWLETYPPVASPSSAGKKNCSSRIERYGALESLQLCGVVVLGFVIGLSGLSVLQHATEASEYTLIFIVPGGDSATKQRCMTLKQIVLNRRGMMVAVVVVASQLIGR